MNTVQLEYLEAVIRRGSYVAAASELFVTPQAVSKSVKALESEFDISIIEQLPGKRRLTLTRQGEAFAAHAKKIMTEINEMQLISFLDNGLRGETGAIRCAIPSWGEKGELFPVDLEGRYLKKNGERLAAPRWTSDACVSGLMTGVVDAAVCLGGLNQSPYIDRYLFSFTPKLIVGKNSPLASFKAATSSDLSKVKIAMPFDIMSGYTALVSKARQLGLHYSFVNINYGLDSFRRFLEEDDSAILVLGSSDICRSIDAVELPIVEEDGISFPVYLSYRKAASFDVDNLAEFLESVHF